MRHKCLCHSTRCPCRGALTGPRCSHGRPWQVRTFTACAGTPCRGQSQSHRLCTAPFTQTCPLSSRPPPSWSARRGRGLWRPRRSPPPACWWGSRTPTASRSRRRATSGGSTTSTSRICSAWRRRTRLSYSCSASACATRSRPRMLPSRSRPSRRSRWSERALTSTSAGWSRRPPAGGRSSTGVPTPWQWSAPLARRRTT
mmetsp:Transcript_2962/g.7978  ORF Transcript_2962/g.7978 Transcript_2962/m.7978 type:complete len:200 (+) Transcript_2962:298-897(+)